MNPAQIIILLLQVIDEFAGARKKAQEALAAQGLELDQLMEEAKRENHVGILDLISTGPAVQPEQPVFKGYNTWFPGNLPSDDDLKSQGFKQYDWKWTAPGFFLISSQGASSVAPVPDGGTAGMVGSIS